MDYITIPSEKIASYLQAKQIQCPVCKGELTGIGISPGITGQYDGSTDDRMYKCVVSRIESATGFIKTGNRAAGFFVVPTLCHDCGAIQMFSLGAIDNFEAGPEND